jgi:AbiV family abortive infection protein
VELKEAMREVMKESIRNAEQWLKEARLIQDKGSLAHTCVLRDLAGEEIAKAYACWQVLAGALPTNHPLVRPGMRESTQDTLNRLEEEAKREKTNLEKGRKPRKDISIFTSHSMKYALITDLASQFLTPPQETPPTKEGQAFLGALKMVMGEFGVLKRQEWLYVNLFRESGEYGITSPLRPDSDLVECNLVLQEQVLSTIKGLTEADPRQFSDWSEARRKELIEKDAYMPDNPVWIS